MAMRTSDGSLINVTRAHIDTHTGQLIPAARISRNRYHVYIPATSFRYVADQLHDLADEDDAYERTYRR